MRVLYVEDEKFLADAVQHNLEKSGIKTDLARDGEEGLDKATNDIYDVIILDIMLPKISGLDILKHLRERKIKTPIIMLSALSEVEDKVRGLDTGADDYLAKPFKTTELVARINALVRRPAEINNTEITYLDLRFNPREKVLNGVTLTKKEADIIGELIKTPEKVVAKEYLLNKIWGDEVYSEDNYVEVYVSRLRKLLKKLNSKTKIVTMRGTGYKIVKA